MRTQAELQHRERQYNQSLETQIRRSGVRSAARRPASLFPPGLLSLGRQVDASNTDSVASLLNVSLVVLHCLVPNQWVVTRDGQQSDSAISSP